jgi:hypothetical protein
MVSVVIKHFLHPNPKISCFTVTFFTEVRGMCRKQFYPELWILRYPVHRYHAVPSPGFEPTILWLKVRRPNHSATTLHIKTSDMTRTQIFIFDNMNLFLLGHTFQFDDICYSVLESWSSFQIEITQLFLFVDFLI